MMSGKPGFIDTSVITGIVGFVAFAVLSYVFSGVLSYIPYFFGLLFGFLNFPIALVSSYIYPVGALPSITISAGILVVVIFVVLSYIFGGKSS